MNTNPDAKRILCFGDSYTWGYTPGSKHVRIPADQRRTGVLQTLLGDDYEVIEEGLNSRTLISEDPRPGKEGRNGSEYLVPCLESHDPIDLVVLMLGTNEAKTSYDKSLEEIGEILESKFVKVILGRQSQFRGTTPKLLLIAPPYINEDTEYSKERYLGSREKTVKMGTVYQTIANNNACAFINSGTILEVGIDGVHLDLENSRKLADAIYKKIKEIF